MRIAFLGTPEFALPSLIALHEAGHELCVFTQPDRPQGRKAIITPPPVKLEAIKRGIKVYQPEKIRDDEGVEQLLSFAPELMVTAAFGQLLSSRNLSIPEHGCINVHGSLLPKYRGAAPIQWAVINGERYTGITTMQTDIGLDTGDILLQEKLEILPDETAGELYVRMAELGARLLLATIARLQAGTLVKTPQDRAEATSCKMLTKLDGKLDFTKKAAKVHNRVRGVNPWPVAYALLNDNPIKIYRSRLSDIVYDGQTEPGLCFTRDDRLYVCCADAPLEILELQASGSKRLDAASFVRGKPLDGEILL